MATSSSGGGWQSNEKLVLTELERNHEDHQVLRDGQHRLELLIERRFSDIKSEVTALKVKAAIGGAVAGGILAAVISAVAGKLS